MHGMRDAENNHWDYGLRKHVVRDDRIKVPEFPVVLKKRLEL